MKILHLCLACFYIDEYNYQENILPNIHKQQGHDVLIIASTETYVDNTHLGYLKPSKYLTEFGVPIIRLPYKKIGPQKIQAKLRLYHGLYDEICNFKPDIIMAHDLSFLSVTDVVDYVKQNPSVKFYADTHTAAYNSGKNWLSLNVLHRMIYRRCIQKAIPYLNKYLYLSSGEKQFSIENYGMPEEIMEFYPLGGIIPADSDYIEKRFQIRDKLQIDDKELLFVHSGKLNKNKRTEELLEAFTSVKNLKARLVIIGSIAEDIRSQTDILIKSDDRISYEGWKSGEELRDYLCAADLYLQPGTVSATMQIATCCRCPILSFPHKAYLDDFDYGQFIWTKSKEEIQSVFEGILNGKYNLSTLSKNAQTCAETMLDYNVLARRISG